MGPSPQNTLHEILCPYNTMDEDRVLLGRGADHAGARPLTLAWGHLLRRKPSPCPPRPETMLGDTAVAVHPEDERYRDLVGLTLTLPVLGRQIPVIADARVDKEFATGALKVTPAHDFTDFEIGKEHGLPMISVLDEQARMTQEAGLYQGLDRYECRAKLVEDLRQSGTLIGVEPYKIVLGHCYRCRTVVEPLLSIQWFV